MTPYDVIDLGWHCFSNWLLHELAWSLATSSHYLNQSRHVLNRCLWNKLHIHILPVNKTQLKMVCAKCRPFCSVLNMSLQWRHNERVGVSNHQPHDCLLNRLFRPRSKKTSKLRVTGEFPAQSASNAENVSIWWRHHVIARKIKKEYENIAKHVGINQN